MKHMQYVLLVAAIGCAGGAAASAVTPSVTGTVTQVTSSGGVRRVTLNGHVYTVDANTKTDSASGPLQAGQTVTMLVAKDGTTAMMVHAATSTATHP